MVKAYYNEYDKSAAAWLRELIKEGVITDGTVDERSIEDVVPAELAEFDRCHFFAGIGVWDHALTRAGWRDGDGPVWTGSCPCQPFSAAGKGDGFADERHLWPAWFHLIEQCRPRVIFGEQVSSKDTLPWIDLVHADLEGALYTVAAADLCSPSVGAPHIRQRLYFVGELADTDRRASRSGNVAESIGTQQSKSRTDGSSESHELAKPVSVGRRGRRDGDSPGDGGEIQIEGRGGIGESGSVAVSDGGNSGTERLQRSGQHGQQPQDGRIGQLADTEGTELAGNFTEEGWTLGHSPTNGFWRDAEWIYCRDGKWRPVGTIESGAFEMADELAADLGCVRNESSGKYTVSPLIEKGKGRVARLRGYGNAIVAEVATKWIESYLDK